MTRTRAAPEQPGFAAPGFAEPAPTLRRPRNLPGAILGILLVVVCSLVVAAVASSSDHRTQVLVIAKPIAAGTTIAANDLRSAPVAAGHQVQGIRASQASTVVGRVAADNLVPGTLLVNAEVASGPLLTKGSAIVGVALKAGFLPAGLTPQDTVSVLNTPTGTGGTTGSDATGSGGTGSGTTLVSAASVVSVATSADGQSMLVSLDLPTGDAPAVAEANAQGNITLVVVGG